jgi:hypothetical protein
MLQKALRPQLEGTVEYDGFTLEFYESVLPKTWDVKVDGELIGSVEVEGVYWNHSRNMAETKYKTEEAASKALLHAYINS